MAGTLFNSTTLDPDGRQFLLNNVVVGLHYYTTVGETWDRLGQGGQSWYREVFLPSDVFDTADILTDRWVVLDTTEVSERVLAQAGGRLTAGITKDEGVVGLSSLGKWKLSGDFDIRLYIDWDSYYNEYRSVAHTFLKVGVDSENAVRIAFTFDGEGFVFSSEKAVDRDLTYFDWQDNGDLLELDDFADATSYKYLRITRTSGEIKTYVSTGVSDTLVGEARAEDVFSEDAFVEFGVENKEYNTYQTAFTKFLVSVGNLDNPIEFFSSVRGRRAVFPERAIIALDGSALSIIDEDESRLWLRIFLGSESPLPAETTALSACNGVLYCATSDGVIAFDFHRDKIYKYKAGVVYVADEPLSLRNSEVTLREFFSAAGTIPDDNVHSVSCTLIGGTEYLAHTHDDGVTIRRALASGVANCSDGSLPGSRVRVSPLGRAYWICYDPYSNAGELSYHSDVSALDYSGTSSFSRTGYYSDETPLRLQGKHPTCFDVLTVNGADLLAVGSTEGISFLAFSPGAAVAGSFTYGVESVPANPVVDPSFEGYVGDSWKVLYEGGFHQKASVSKQEDFTGAGDSCLRMRFLDISLAPQTVVSGTTETVYQDVDLTGVSTLYFDIKLTKEYATPGTGTGAWDFEILVDSSVVKTYHDIDGPFTKYNDSVDVSAFSGTCRLSFRLRVVRDLTSTVVSSLGSRAVYLDNLRTSVGTPDYRILPPGEASILEVLLQYDSSGHKVYFTTYGGYGAVDLDSHSLDYFLPADTYLPGAEIRSAEFSRIEEDVS